MENDELRTIFSIQQLMLKKYGKNEKKFTNYVLMDTEDVNNMISNVVKESIELFKDGPKYFVRYPDRLVECVDTLPKSCDLDVVSKRHKFFYTKEEALANADKDDVFEKCPFNTDDGWEYFYGYNKKR